MHVNQATSAAPNLTLWRVGSKPVATANVARVRGSRTGGCIRPSRCRGVTRDARCQGVTLFGCCDGHERIEHFGMRIRIGPILRDAAPLGAQTLFIDIGILDDERLQPLLIAPR